MKNLLVMVRLSYKHLKSSFLKFIMGFLFGLDSGKEGPVAKALLDLLLEDTKSGPPSVRVRVPY